MDYSQFSLQINDGSANNNSWRCFNQAIKISTVFDSVVIVILMVTLTVSVFLP